MCVEWRSKLNVFTLSQHFKAVTVYCASVMCMQLMEMI